LHPEIERCHITLHVLGDIGFEPSAAGVAVDAALDDVVGSVGGDGSHGKQEDDSGGRRKDAERGHGRRINVSSPLDAGEKGWEPFIWWERGEEGSETSLVFLQWGGGVLFITWEAGRFGWMTVEVGNSWRLEQLS